MSGAVRRFVCPCKTLWPSLKHFLCSYSVLSDMLILFPLLCSENKTWTGHHYEATFYHCKFCFFVWSLKKKMKYHPLRWYELVELHYLLMDVCTKWAVGVNQAVFVLPTAPCYLLNQERTLQTQVSSTKSFFEARPIPLVQYYLYNGRR